MEDTSKVLNEIMSKLEKHIEDLKNSEGSKQNEVFSLYALQNAIRQTQKRVELGNAEKSQSTRSL